MSDSEVMQLLFVGGTLNFFIATHTFFLYADQCFNEMLVWTCCLRWYRLYCQKSTDKARVLGYKDLKFQPTPEQTVKALDLLLIIITQCIKYIILRSSIGCGLVVMAPLANALFIGSGLVAAVFLGMKRDVIQAQGIDQ